MPASLHDNPTNMVLEGQAAMWVLGLPMEATIRTDNNVVGTVADLPCGKTDASPMLVDGFGISAGTRHPAVAWRWLAFLSQQNIPSQFAEWSALRSAFERETLARDRGITQQAADAVRAAVVDAVPVQLEYGALQRTLLELPQVCAGEKSVSQILGEATQAQAQTNASKPVLVSTPLPPTTEAQTTIVFVPSRGRMGAFQDTRAYEALADEFREQNPDIQVIVQTFNDFVSSEDIAKRSDVFLGKRQVPREWPKEDQYTVLVQDLRPLLDADPTFDSGDFLNTDFVLPPRHDESALWGIPVSFDAVGIFYDKEKFQAAGIAEPRSGWTWDDFRLIAAQLASDKDDLHYGYVSRSDTLDLELFLLGRGLALPADDPENTAFSDTSIDIRSPDLKPALAWWVGLAQVDKSMAPIEASSSFDTVLSQRRAAMWADFMGNLNRSHPVYNLARSEAWNLGFAPLPQGEHTVAAIQYNIAYISARAQNREACWKWVRFLSERLPPGSMAPARRSLLESDIFRQQVGAEMQAAYLRVAELYAQGERMVDRDNLGSSFLLTFVQAIREGRSVDAALDEARQ